MTISAIATISLQRHQQIDGKTISDQPSDIASKYCHSKKQWACLPQQEMHSGGWHGKGMAVVTGRFPAPGTSGTTGATVTWHVLQCSQPLAINDGINDGMRAIALEWDKLHHKLVANGISAGESGDITCQSDSALNGTRRQPQNGAVYMLLGCRTAYQPRALHRPRGAVAVA